MGKLLPLTEKKILVVYHSIFIFNIQLAVTYKQLVGCLPYILLALRLMKHYQKKKEKNEGKVKEKYIKKALNRAR